MSAASQKYPGVNRFFSGQRVYQRDDDVQFTMTIKKDMRTDGEETTIKLHLKPTDTTKEVYEEAERPHRRGQKTPPLTARSTMSRLCWPVCRASC